jgi:hypothetical protein
MAVISLPKKEYEILKNKAEKYDQFVSKCSEEDKTKRRYSIKDLIKGFNGREKEFWNYPPMGKEAW